jgi:hypothetical protein
MVSVHVRIQQPSVLFTLVSLKQGRVGHKSSGSIDNLHAIKTLPAIFVGNEKVTLAISFRTDLRWFLV